MRKKRIFVNYCNWCKRELILNGDNSDSYVVTAERKYFCIIQTPGKPAERDCMSDYLNNERKILNDKISNEAKLKEEKEKKEKEEEKKIEAFRPIAIQKLEALKKHFENSPTKSSHR